MAVTIGQVIALIKALAGKGGGGGSGGVSDVQVNGTSVVTNGVANVPIANGNAPGVIIVSSSFGHNIDINNRLIHKPAATATVKGGVESNDPIVPKNQHEAAFYGLAKAAGDTSQASSSNEVGTYTPAAKAAIQSMLGVSPGVSFVETVSGSTPSITGEANVRYICGEVSAITITPPPAGTIVVRFESGSTPAVLSFGGNDTVLFPDGVDLTTLEADTIYEIMVTDGVYGAVMTWAASTPVA